MVTVQILGGTVNSKDINVEIIFVPGNATG